MREMKVLRLHVYKARMAELKGKQVELYHVFLWGANSYGQLGLGHKEDTLIPSDAQCHFSKLLQITGGGGHTVLVGENGQIHVCGWNKNGQLGISNAVLTDVIRLEPLHGLTQKVIKLSCGWNHCLSIAEGGQMLVWGSNSYGQLGTPSVLKQADFPVPLSVDVFAGSPVHDISAGLRHSIALTEDGRVYTWGDCRKGQLGHGKSNLSTQLVPTYVESLLGIKCKSVAAGGYHSGTITVNGELMIWGLNQHGQCGVGKKTERVNPDQVKVTDDNWVLNVYEPLAVPDLPPLIELHNGWSNTLVISVHRQVFAWGRSDYGQLGTGGVTDSAPSPGSCCHMPKEIPELRGVRQLACGSEHTIALDADNRVVTFGWNEHGMCGTGDEVNVYTPHIVKLVEEHLEPVLVGAGAGHSMVAAQVIVCDSSSHDQCV